jgi:hypothetical protein
MENTKIHLVNLNEFQVWLENKIYDRFNETLGGL